MQKWDQYSSFTIKTTGKRIRSEWLRKEMAHLLVGLPSNTFFRARVDCFSKQYFSITGRYFSSLTLSRSVNDPRPQKIYFQDFILCFSSLINSCQHLINYSILSNRINIVYQYVKTSAIEPCLGFYISFGIAGASKLMEGLRCKNLQTLVYTEFRHHSFFGIAYLQQKSQSTMICETNRPSSTLLPSKPSLNAPNNKKGIGHQCCHSFLAIDKTQ